MPNLALRVNGRDYLGWTSAQITRGIENLTGSFALEVSEKLSDAGDPFPIADEDEVTVLIEKESVLTGFVDRRSINVDAQSHRFSVEGRDKAGALVDCSAVLTRWEFSNIGVLELCQEVAKPFGISVGIQEGLSDSAISTAPRPTSTKTPGGAPSAVGSAGKSSSSKIGKPNETLRFSPGDSAFEIIDRACRSVGVLPVSNGLGGVILTRAGGTRCTTALVEGKNIFAIGATFDATKRYRTYRVYGQSAGTDEDFGPITAHVVGQPATDLGVRRANRVLIVQPEGPVDLKFATARGRWEAAVRAARAIQTSVTVQGWTQDDGTLWPYGAIVSIKSPRASLDGLMLITQTTFALSVEGGSTTTLQLTRPDAFLPEPVLTSDAGLRHIPELDNVK